MQQQFVELPNTYFKIEGLNYDNVETDIDQNQSPKFKVDSLCKQFLTMFFTFKVLTTELKLKAYYCFCNNYLSQKNKF